jgi:hypothetical protein
MKNSSPRNLPELGEFGKHSIGVKRVLMSQVVNYPERTRTHSSQRAVAYSPGTSKHGTANSPVPQQL